MRRWIVLSAMAAALAMTLGCRAQAPSDDEDSSQSAIAPVLAVTAAKASFAPMSSKIKILGTTVALRHLTLRAPSAGRVIGFNLASGDRVTRGEVVAHILNREDEAAENGLEIAQQIDPAEAPSLARSVNHYKDTRGVAVEAPETAIVAQPLVSSGQTVADLDPLADLVDPASIYIDAAVPIDDLRLIRPGMEAAVTSPLDPGVIYPARIEALSPSFSQSGATAPVRIAFTASTRIDEAGAPVEIEVTTRDVPNALVIPVTALFQRAQTGGFYVFVATDGKAHRRAVEIGIRTPDAVQIVGGLKAGDAVITSGGYALSDGLKVEATGGHN